MTESEVLVVGGGPAGCAAATLLRRWGHAVTLVTKPASDTLALGESIPPSTQKLFDLLGLTAAMDAGGFVRSTGNTVWWGTDVPRVEFFAGHARGWQVTTAGLESICRRMAAESGVAIEVTRLDAGGVDARRAAFVLDCSGRAGVLARARHLRVHEVSAQTIAIVGVWTAHQFAVPDQTHTIIESYDGGWIWSVPVAPSERHVAVMVDPRRSNLARDAASRQVYLAEIAKTAQLRRILRGATLIDGPRGWQASMYHATRYVDEHIVLVGDAGSFIDPLSSVGIKKALASAWLAAVATHTSLVKPAMRSVALEFFDARERDVYATLREMTDRYWRDAAQGHQDAFWNDRTAEPDMARENGDVRAAFERLRVSPTLRLVANADARIEQRPAVCGTEIVLEPRLVHASRPSGVRFAYDVDLLGLVQLAPAARSVPELFTAYNLRHPSVPMPAFLGALATAIAEQWLRWCDTN